MSGTLTYLQRAIVDQAVKELDGKTLGPPSLIVSDGVALTYGVDVDIGQTTIDPNTADEVVVPLRQVAIAAGNNELMYASAGTGVRLRRSESGRFEVVGFSKRIPGSYTRVEVTIPELGGGLPTYELAPATEIGLIARRLTLGELGTLGIFGTTPLGAIGIFRGTTLVEVK